MGTDAPYTTLVIRVFDCVAGGRYVEPPQAFTARRSRGPKARDRSSRLNRSRLKVTRIVPHARVQHRETLADALAQVATGRGGFPCDSTMVGFFITTTSSQRILGHRRCTRFRYGPRTIGSRTAGRYAHAFTPCGVATASIGQGRDPGRGERAAAGNRDVYNAAAAVPTYMAAPPSLSVKRGMLRRPVHVAVVSCPGCQ
jgi:hypothetical protein